MSVNFLFYIPFKVSTIKMTRKDHVCTINVCNFLYFPSFYFKNKYLIVLRTYISMNMSTPFRSRTKKYSVGSQTIINIILCSVSQLPNILGKTLVAENVMSLSHNYMKIITEPITPKEEKNIQDIKLDLFHISCIAFL
jgi:hypothetical protein